MSDGLGELRIGELSRRTGVSPELLRAWEQRYKLLHPTRSPGGYRLYSLEDEGRVRRMTTLIGQGLSAAEAASRAAAAAGLPSSSDDLPSSSEGPLVDDLASRLAAALDSFDTEGAQAAFDRLLAALSVELVLTDVVLPYLRDLGARWSAGRASIAQEHFASSLIRGRLLGLARDWGTGAGPSALLACLPGEVHDLGLIAFGVLIARRGWQVTFLGADTPLDTVTSSAQALRPALVVLATVDGQKFQALVREIRAVAEQVAVAVVAPGVDPQDVAAIGARPLPTDILAAARALEQPG
ncbi:MAG TPA: MerR family transcriptional regulator [Frankiaceae bacterium]|nr:MerR family transcriptional regulator [Frankiaceae bacterium]